MNINVTDQENLSKKGIYSITNLVNNKKYIGSTKKSFLTRFKQHYQELINNKHFSQHLQNAWNKNGEEKFEFSIVEIVENITDDTLLILEGKYIQIYDSINNGYNINPNPNISPMYNQSSREKSSKTHKEWWEDKKNKLSEEEYKELCKKYVHSYGKEPWNKGIKMTSEQTKNMKKPKINGVSDKMKEVFKNNSKIAREKADYILIFDKNQTWINTFYCISDLIEYSKSKNNNLPIIHSKGKSRFGNTLSHDRLLLHIKEGTQYKGLYFKRAPKSWKLSYANAENSWKADQEPIMSRAEGTPSEGAETSGEVQSS